MPTTKTTTTSDTEPTGAADKPAVTKIGNLTSDPELRYATSGKAFTRMRLAVSTPKVPGDWAGERETTFYDLTAFGSLAENAAECLAKGDRVVVTGRGEVRTWTGDDGVEHREKGILVDALGPDLRWTTATLTRTRRRSAAEAFAGDDEAF